MVIQYDISEEIVLDKNIKHNIEIIVDRLVIKPGIERRLSESVESVLEEAEGLLIVDVIGGEPLNFSQSFSCPDCGVSVDEIEPRSFSLTIHLVHVHYVQVLDIRWSLQKSV